MHRASELLIHTVPKPTQKQIMVIFQRGLALLPEITKIIPTTITTVGNIIFLGLFLMA